MGKASGAGTKVDKLISPKSMTVLCTYQCTAACQQCCFESNPSITGRLDSQTIQARILEAIQAFPDIRVVVFSGGEAFLLKEQLTECIAFATRHGLGTRVVTNGFWAKRMERAETISRAVSDAGLSELNISTGRDHQAFVPGETVINAAIAAVGAGIRTLITVETDTAESDCHAALMSDPRIGDLVRSGKLTVISNFWMPFHADAPARAQEPDVRGLRKGCKQVFDNIVITPHDNLSACCGLTLEHIPELRLGKNTGDNIRDDYLSQSQDFMKYWLSVDGPYTIIERVAGTRAEEFLQGVVHQCQACAVLHRTPFLKEEAVKQYPLFAKEIMTRFILDRTLDMQKPSKAGA